MSDEETDEFMGLWDWAKWSDCRAMLQEMYHKGFKAGQESMAPRTEYNEICT